MAEKLGASSRYQLSACESRIISEPLKFLERNCLTIVFSKVILLTQLSFIYLFCSVCRKFCFITFVIFYCLIIKFYQFQSSKGKGKGKSSSKNNSKKSTPNDESTSSSSRKKKKKHKKSDKPPPSPALNTSSSDADDENDYEKQPSKKSSRKSQKSKSKRKDREKKKKKVNNELAKILKKRKDRKRSSTAASSLNSSTASEEEKPLSKWKVSINSSRKTSQSTLSDGSAEGGGSRTFVLKPEAETEDLRLFLSRKRPRILDEDSSGTDDERHKRAKTVKSVVVVPK